jgi:hypothetical protein
MELIEYKEMREAIHRVREIVKDLKLVKQTSTSINIDVVISSIENALDGEQ